VIVMVIEQKGTVGAEVTSRWRKMGAECKTHVY
jgi:hypothetical protein